MLPALVAAWLLAGAEQPPPKPPRPAPPVFVTANHGLTFRSPPGATYCPLPEDFHGSDHGTDLLLNGGLCTGPGFPSVGRFVDTKGVAAIMVYYGYDPDAGEDEPRRRPPCRKVATVRLLGADRPVCRERYEGRIYYSVEAKYRADAAREVSLSLLTTPERLKADLETLRAFAATVQTCAAPWEGMEPVGVGPPCPKDGVFF
ncbi:hypothetical protein DMC25_22330 [Caulobacter sp. D4A]|uniref:hypothetical protein n=1 Tax=unclassified Caulobacter TaxID=2648921 RepID=UPI000D73C414|nr:MULTISPECIES: hypothetical protein [unclassified Caulobacter]PXA78692.1 hypothetical protein DMC25_22330 [Caulobacter sp. D4A]PXA90661.1 hypothetical protein DMC18_14450 [Caulobacter sp. D5]